MSINKQILNFATFADFPDVGAANYLYIDNDTKKIFFWNGFNYVFTIVLNEAAGVSGADLLFYPNFLDFPTVGDISKFYIEEATNLIFRFNGFVYVQLSPDNTPFLIATITPPVILGGQNDFSPAGLAPRVWLRLAASSNIIITGINSAGFSDRDLVAVTNISGFKITLKNNDASSAPANRFLLSGNFVITQQQGFFLIRDAAADRWRVLSNV